MTPFIIQEKIGHHLIIILIDFTSPGVTEEKPVFVFKSSPRGELMWKQVTKEENLQMHESTDTNEWYKTYASCELKNSILWNYSYQLSYSWMMHFHIFSQFLLEGARKVHAKPWPLSSFCFLKHRLAIWWACYYNYFRISHFLCSL
jgi:hypothetical protein